MKPLAGMTVPSGMRYFIKLSPESLMYQPLISTGAPVVFFSSIQSLGPVGLLASTSFTTTAFCGGETVSSIPGVPSTAVEACHDAALLNEVTSASGLLITSESPLPSVEGYQVSE